MPTYRCDFRVSSDVVFESAQRLVRLQVGDTTFTHRNEPPAEDGHSHALIVNVVGESESLETAADDLRHALADHLNALAFALQSRFKIDRTIRAIEWTPFQKERRIRQFHAADPRDPPAPDLQVIHFATAGEIARAAASPAVRTAMRYFRYGMLNATHEDQFFNLWLSLEIVAESTPKTRVAIVCKECGNDLVCLACGHASMRTPSGKHSIEPLIRLFSESDSDAATRRLFDARNKLLHGSSAESIAEHCGRPLSEIVDELGYISWRAILSLIRFWPDGWDMEFANWGGEFARYSHVAAFELLMSHDGPEEHPPEDKIPNAEISLTVKFGSLQAPKRDSS